jgi:hypothetical protein
VLLPLAGLGVGACSITLVVVVDADTGAAFLVAVTAGPLLAAFLAVLPPVRRWVRTRRAVRSASR